MHLFTLGKTEVRSPHFPDESGRRKVLTKQMFNYLFIFTSCNALVILSKVRCLKKWASIYRHS